MADGVLQNTMSFDEAWPILQEEAINKIINKAEGIHTNDLTSEEYMRFYTLVYSVCTPNIHDPDAQKMYDHYKKTFEDHVSSKALPSLRGKTDIDLLQELLRRWKIHKTITYWLKRFFHYLERYLISLKKLPSLVATSYLTFYNLVYGEMNDQIRDAIISLINKEREGEEIDQALVKDVVDIYVEIGEGSKKYYEKDFEETFMNATTTFYSTKVLEWIANDSYEDYMVKVEGCLNKEKTRVSGYLKFRTKNRAIEIAENELLNVHSSKLAEKKHSYDVQNAS